MTNLNRQRCVRRAATLASAAAGLTGCAGIQHGARTDAVSAALQNVCGSPRVPADSSCTVRTVTHVADGYRVVIDRRPPAGNDRVAVLVRPGGMFGGSRIDVTPVDTTRTPRLR